MSTRSGRCYSTTGSTDVVPRYLFLDLTPDPTLGLTAAGHPDGIRIPCNNKLPFKPSPTFDKDPRIMFILAHYYNYNET